MLAETEQIISLKNIDKSDWKTYRFDEIAQNISERVDPNNTDLDVYIGLEHLDSESIHIRRFGQRGDVNGQKLRFYPGDVIFGRRRAYQRKAGIAATDGFCSAHALVLRANPEVIEPSLFPFFLHSDAFMHRAVDISVGSLSPTINWGALKKQEFLLPTKEKQTVLTELLGSLDNVLTTKIGLLTKLLTRKMVVQKEVYDLSIELSDLGDLFDVKWGNTNITKKSYVDQGFDAYSASGRDGYLTSYEHDQPGIVLSAIGADCGKCFYAKGKWTSIKNTITIFPRDEDSMFLDIVFEMINNKSFWPSSGGAQPFISQSDARRVKIPKLEQQTLEKIHKSYHVLNRSISSAETSVEKSKFLFANILNQVF